MGLNNKPRAFGVWWAVTCIHIPLANGPESAVHRRGLPRKKKGENSFLVYELKTSLADEGLVYLSMNLVP